MKRKQQIFRLIFLSGLLTIFIGQMFAEGSATIYPSGATGKRASLQSRSRNVPRLFDLFPTLGTMKVYVKANETLYVGSSAQGVNQTYGTPAVTYTGTINLRAPNGNTYTSGTSTTVGKIATRTQELAGPNRTGVTTGYTPYTRTVAASEEGIWEIDFVPPTNPDTVSVPAYNVDADAAWVQQKRAMIVAWDVSVGSASSAATLIPGRLYCNNFNGNVSGTDNSASPLNVTFYVLTNVGYVYRVNTNGQNGKGFNFFINNKGVQSSSTGIANPDSITTKSWKNGLPSYKSLEYSNYKSQIYMYDPRLPDNGSEDVTHKIFFNTPALDLPTSASIRYNGVAPTISTWLRYAVDLPQITNVSLTGAEGGLANTSGPDGANVTFTSNVAGKYTVTIGLSSPYTSRTLTGNCVQGQNTVLWDGFDGSATPQKVTIGSSVSIVSKVTAGEMHFPLVDLETNPNGMKIELLQPNYSLYSPTKDVVYWDDSNITSTGNGFLNPPSPKQNLTGSPSASGTTPNGHKWGAQGSGIVYENQWGQNKILDTWAYAIGESSPILSSLQTKNLDLAVNSITPSTTSTVVGNTITYTIVVTNPSSTGYTDPAVGAKFGFVAPAGFTITSASTGSVTGTFLENSRSATGSNTFTTNFNLTSAGSVTYTITGTVGSGMAHITNSTVTAYVIRPDDYTDKDATSAIIGATGTTLTDAQNECNGGTSGTGCNNIKTTTVTVNNTTPVAVNDFGSVNEDATLTVIAPGVKTNDTDVDGDALTVTSIRKGNSEGSGDPGSLGVALTGTYGTLNILADGSYTYIANNAQSLAAGATAHDFFNYTISDSNGGTDVAVIDITITGTNDAPVAVNDFGAVNEDATLYVPANGVLGNDTDVDTGNTKTVTSVRTGNTEGSGTSGSLGVALPGVYGTLTLNADGSYTYIANNAQALAAGATAHDYFNYTMSDGTASDIAVIEITITGTNDAPVAINDINTTFVNMPVGGKVLTNDFDPENNRLTVNTSPVNSPNNGTVVLYPDGNYTYTPNNGFTGEDTFTYQVCDNGTPALCDNATVTIEVMPLPTTANNNTPVAVNDAYQGSFNRVVTGTVIANDFDADKNTLTVIDNENGKYDSDGNGTLDTQLPIGTATTVYGQNSSGSYVVAGSLTQNDNGLFSFEPATGFVGQVTYSYVISDLKGGTDDAFVTIDITNQGTNTTNALNDINTTNINTAVSGNVLSNDYDRQGNTMTVTNPGTYTTASGVLVIASDGTYTFTPASEVTGDYDFTYTMCDNGIPQACEDAILTITVMPLFTAGSDLPVAINDMYIGSVNTIITENVRVNDIDVDQNGLSVITNAAGKYDSNGDGNPDTELQIGNETQVWGINTSNQPVLAGSLTLNANGYFTFVPVTNFVGLVNYSYVIKDGDNDTDGANVTIEIRGGNSTFATDDSFIGYEDTKITGNILSNDYDPQGNNQSVNTEPISDPAHGTVILNTDGTFTYTPVKDYFGPDQFIYRLCDNATMTACNTATVYLNVIDVKEYCAWQSIKVGDWTDNTVWIGLDCATNVWEPVPVAPNNDRPIYVYHTVSIPANTDISADSLFIKPTGKVSVPATSTLTATDQLIIGIDKDGGAGQLNSNGDCDNIVTKAAKIIVRKALDSTWDFISFPFNVVQDSVFVGGTRTKAKWGDIIPSTSDANFYAAQYDGAARALNENPNALIGNYWINVTDRTFVPVRGYIVTGGNRGADSLDFVAAANTQLVLCNGNYTPENYAPTPLCNGGWCLVGTPYVSAYDLYYASPYKAYYIAPGYTPVATGQNGILNAFGAFFMQATGSAPVTYPIAGLPQAAPRQKPKYNNLTLAINNTARSNITMVRLAEDANVNYQLGEDAMNMNINSSSPQIYSEAAGACSGLAVNTLPLNTERVDLKIRIGTAGVYTIKLTEKDKLNNIKSAMLIDTETNAQTDLIESDGYTFDATATGISNRFYLKLHTENTSDVNPAGNNGIELKIKGKRISLTGIVGNAGVRMYDVVGKLMYQYRDLQNEQSFDVNVPGVYLMDINTETQNARVKVLIQDK